MSKTLVGKVVSTRMDKTIIVSVVRLKSHPLYKKRYKVTTRYAAHDAKNSCNSGDVVEIVETRPMSKTKHFAVAKVIEKAGELT